MTFHLEGKWLTYFGLHQLKSDFEQEIQPYNNDINKGEKTNNNGRKAACECEN